MRGKLYFTISLLILSLPCFIRFLPAQTLPPAAWNVPFQKCWEFETERMSSFAPLADGRQTIFQTLDDGTLAAIDAASGKIVWRSQFGGEIVSHPFFEDNKLYLVNKIVVEAERQEEYVVRSLSAATGLTLWQKSLSLNDAGRIFVLNGGNLIIIVSDAGQILFVDKASGAEASRRELQTAVTAAPLLFENKIIVGTIENKAMAFSAISGEVVFKLDLPNSPTGNFYVSTEVLVFGDRAGNVSAFRAADRKLLWKARAGAQIVDVTEVSGNFLVSSNDGFVYLLASRTGDRIWKKRLAGRLIGKPLIYNNFALLQTVDGVTAPILDINSGKMVNRIIFGDNVFSANSALSVYQRIVIPTNKGLSAYSPDCADK